MSVWNDIQVTCNNISTFVDDTTKREIELHIEKGSGTSGVSHMVTIEHKGRCIPIAKGKTPKELLGKLETYYEGLRYGKYLFYTGEDR